MGGGRATASWSSATSASPGNTGSALRFTQKNRSEYIEFFSPPSRGLKADERGETKIEMRETKELQNVNFVFSLSKSYSIF